MAAPDFFQTIMGKRHYEGTMPSIMRSLEAIATELKRANDLAEAKQEANKEIRETE